ncbi:MAG: sulfatase [Eubacteriales bacterium]
MNILLIHADQHRGDCLGILGNRDIKTPEIDRLAGDGTVYENCFCPYPVCTPSRYSALTGLYPHQHGAFTNHCTLNTNIPTYPRALKNAGYRTAAVGKMHFAPTYLDVGFERMCLAEQDGPGRMEDDYHIWLKHQGLLDSYDIMDQRSEYRKYTDGEYWSSFGTAPCHLPEGAHSTDWIGKQALVELRNWKSNESNLLMVGFIKPHHPFDAPKEWFDLYNPDSLTILSGYTDSIPEWDKAKAAGYFHNGELSENTLKRVMQGYYASISHIDIYVGQMSRLLKEKGLYDDTMIIYTSDHGDYMGYHHMLLKGNYMYDPLARVPLVVKYPMSTPQYKPGTRSQELISGCDLAVSILKTAGVQSGSIPGTPFWQAGREVVFSEAVMGDGWNYMARTQTAKLMISRSDMKYYDLISDPCELRDVSDNSQYSGEIERLREAINHFILFDSPVALQLTPYATEVRTSEQRSRDPQVMSKYFEKSFKEYQENL